MTFGQIKENLKKEFEYLIEKYPIGTPFAIDITIFPASTYDRSSSYLFYECKEKTIESAIFMSINLEELLTEEDELVMKKNGLNEKIDLFHFRLYHEYGHLVHLKEFYEQGGMSYVEGQMTQYEKEVAALKEQLEKKQLNEQEATRLYEKLLWEKSANNFAEKMIQKRKRKGISKRGKEI